MAYEWVAPVASSVVGVVGIAGTAFTSWSARKSAERLATNQRSHIAQDRLYEEKRQAYVGFLEAVEGARASRLTIRLRDDTPANRREIADLATKTVSELSLRREHLRLTGPPIVRELALLTHNHLSKVIAGTLRRTDDDVDDKLLTALLASMKDDLGYELDQADQVALSYRPPSADAPADSPRTEVVT